MNYDKYKNFLQELKLYNECEKIWGDLFKSKMPSMSVAASWNNWLKKSYSNGQFRMDGNPIFSAISLEMKKAVKVVQYPSGEGYVDAARIELFGDDFDEEKISVLVFSCVLSQASVDNFKELLNSWINGEADKEVKQKISELDL